MPWISKKRLAILEAKMPPKNWQGPPLTPEAALAAQALRYIAIEGVYWRDGHNPARQRVVLGLESGELTLGNLEAKE